MIHRKVKSDKRPRVKSFLGWRSKIIRMRYIDIAYGKPYVIGCKFIWDAKNSVHLDFEFTHSFIHKGSVSIKDKRRYKV